MERTGITTFKGAPVTLAGNEVKVGDMAPDFTALNIDLGPVKLSSFRGQVVILSVVPSLDTKVCELQTKRFNEEASKLRAKILTISMDLPFAQRRFCDSFKIDNVTTLSDFKDREFGQKYGMTVKELGLLARGVIVVDKEGKISYIQIVKEVGTEPDYAPVLAEAKRLGA
ncbi:MAG: thiol peroxidase [Spirochaetes bacterium]|nr:MAG: thiol peroxidase [Spirochaetota bacterium]